MTALTKEDFEAGIRQLVEGLTTTIKESLAPVQVATPEPIAETKEELTAAAVETPSAEATVETPAATAVEVEDEVEIDHVALATQFAASELPAAVMTNVISEIKEGKTIEEAIKSQTEIKEAFLATATPGSLRIVESDRNHEQAGSLRDRVLGNLK